MKHFLRFLLYIVLFIPAGFASSEFKEVISFQDKNGRTFSLHPLHTMGEERAVTGLHALFQEEKVYEYYEQGKPKSRGECSALYKRVAPRFQNWSRKQLGWTGVIDENNELVGFLGGKIHLPSNALSEYTLEICFGLLPSLPHKNILKSAFYEYYGTLWPQLDNTITSQISYLKTAVHPGDLSSLAFFNSLYPAAFIGKKISNPAGGPQGQRVEASIPMGVINNKVRLYQARKNS